MQKEESKQTSSLNCPKAAFFQIFPQRLQNQVNTLLKILSIIFFYSCRIYSYKIDYFIGSYNDLSKPSTSICHPKPSPLLNPRQNPTSMSFAEKPKCQLTRQKPSLVSFEQQLKKTRGVFRQRTLSDKKSLPHTCISIIRASVLFGPFYSFTAFYPSFL